MDKEIFDHVFITDICDMKHCMLLFDVLDDYRFIASQFMADGLLANDCCVMVTDEYSHSQILDDLESRGVNTQKSLDEGRLFLLHMDDQFSAKRAFDPDDAVRDWQTFASSAVERGYDHVRCVCEAAFNFETAKMGERRIQYENMLNHELSPDCPFISLCVYDKQKHTENDLKAAVRAHPMLIYGRKVFRNNVYYRPPENWSSKKKSMSELEQWLADVVCQNELVQKIVVKNEKLQTIFKKSHNAMYVHEIEGDDPGMIIDCNQAACSMLGYTKAELLQMTILDIDDHTQATLPAPVAEICQKGSAHFESAHKTKDGRIVPVSINASIVPLERRSVVFSVVQDISTQKRVEKDLALALDATSDGIWRYNLKTLEFKFSNRWAEMLGYVRSEISSFDSFFREKVHPDDRELFVTAFRDYLSGESDTYELELRLETKDGAYKWIVAHWKIVERDEKGVPLMLVGTHSDVTDKKNAEKRLEQSENTFRMLFNDAPVPYQSLDIKGNILTVNEQFCQVLGYSQQELIGKNFSELLRADWVDHFRENFPRFKAMGEVLGVEFEMKKKNGEFVLVSYTGKIGKEADGSFRQTHCVFRDITSERAYQEWLIQAKEAAEQANHAKSMFLANMSHELRTPLNGIMGMHQLLKSTDLSKEQDGYVELAIDSARRLTTLLSDILDLTRIEAGKLNVVEKAFDLKDSFTLSEQLFGPACTQKGVEIHFYIHPDLPRKYSGDPTRLQQILNNLIGNAVKFTESGSILCEAFPLACCQDGVQQILFAITDTGVGIQTDKIESLFNPFTQADIGYKRAYQGAGLGLSIVKQLVGLMGGEVTVASELGKGTEFHFCLPFKIDKTESEDQGEPSLNECREDRSYSLLIVEDERVNRTALQIILKKAGFQIASVENGAEALKELEENEYDLVLMDIQMPIMDGVEATKAIRSGKAGAKNVHLPIIALTAFAMSGDKEKFLNVGMDGYLSKPVEIDALNQLLSELLECSKTVV